MLGLRPIASGAIAHSPGAGAPVAPILEDSWHQGFSLPAFRRPPYTASAQQFAAFVQFAPFEELVSADRWVPSLSEPVRSRKPMHTGAQQFASFVQFAPFYEVVTADRWFAPFSEPTRFRPRLLTAAQPFGRGIEFSLSGTSNLISATLLGQASVRSIPTSNYKLTLADNSRRLLYVAVVSPWSVSDRNA